MFRGFENFQNAILTLKDKWREVPSTAQGRAFSSDLLKLSDRELSNMWTELYSSNCEGSGFSIKGWIHELYKPLAGMKGDWLEVGSGLGFDGIYFAEQGANVTFLDIVPDNLEIVKRICKFKNVNSVKFLAMDKIEMINSLPHFDVIMAIGSLHHAPYELASEERRMFAAHLVNKGRWLEFSYPKERWMREGEKDFTDWGKNTDGERTPWAEWYDLPKLLESLAPHRFDPILNLNFHSDDFIWFDLQKVE